MLRSFLKSKIHRATVTEANLEYEGSVTLDLDLIEQSGMHSYEKVLVVDITNGARLETYVIPGERGSGVVCINGAAAHQVKKGDIIIIMAFALLNDSEIEGFSPKKVVVDSQNKVVRK